MIKNKIWNTHKKLISRLPYKYHIPIKIYKTIYSLLRSDSKETGRTYKNTKKCYKKYLLNPKKATYITTKYYKPKYKERKSPYDISALAYNPIKIAYDNTSNYSNREIAFLILHEIAHNVLGTMNERKCDLFAIRWIKKLIKEELI